MIFFKDLYRNTNHIAMCHIYKALIVFFSAIIFFSFSDLSYKMTEFYWPFIKRTVKFNDIVPLIPFMREQQRPIMKAEHLGDAEKASSIFLNALKESETEGKYQVFCVPLICLFSLC